MYDKGLGLAGAVVCGENLGKIDTSDVVLSPTHVLSVNLHTKNSIQGISSLAL